MIHSKRAALVLSVAFTVALLGSGCVADPSADDAADVAAPTAGETTGDGARAGDETTADAKEACGCGCLCGPAAAFEGIYFSRFPFFGPGACGFGEFGAFVAGGLGGGCGGGW